MKNLLLNIRKFFSIENGFAVLPGNIL